MRYSFSIADGPINAYDLQENYLALFLSIITTASADVAFKTLTGEGINLPLKTDDPDTIQVREHFLSGLNSKQIAQKMGLTRNQVLYRLGRKKQ